MRLLLDTQSLIWYVDQDHLLSRLAHAAIIDHSPALICCRTFNALYLPSRHITVTSI
jgi:hypothetical protein